LIADHAGCAVGGPRVDAAGVHRDFGAGHKEGAGLVQGIQPAEVHVGAIHHMEGSCLEAQQVQHVHIVQVAVADME